MDILNEIVNASCGINAQNKPKAAFALECSMWPVDVDENSNVTPRNIATRSSYKPIIEIEKHNEFIQIDLIFQSCLDGDLKLIWNLLEKYGDLLNEVSDESVEVPTLISTITPVIYDGQYYIMCMSPLFWTLQPQKPGGQSNVIRLLFLEEDLNVFETDEINIDDIDNEIERDTINKEATYAHMAAKENEYAQQLSEREARLEKINNLQTEDVENSTEKVDEFDDITENSAKNTGNGRFKII